MSHFSLYPAWRHPAKFRAALYATVFEHIQTLRRILDGTAHWIRYCLIIQKEWEIHRNKWVQNLNPLFMRTLSSLASRFIPLTPAYIFTYILFGLLHFMFVAMFRTPHTPYLNPSISCVNEVFRSPTSTTMYSELGWLLAMRIYHNSMVITVV